MVNHESCHAVFDGIPDELSVGHCFLLCFSHLVAA
jgi:hypothetical protein